MKIQVKNYHFGYKQPVAVFVTDTVSVNGKPSKWTTNRNPKLQFNGKPFPAPVKGTWSQEKLEASMGNY